MKKLMVAAAIVCAAALAQASTANWRWNGTSSAVLYSFDSKTTALSSGTLYIFLDGQQQNVYNQWKKDGTMLEYIGEGEAKQKVQLHHKDIEDGRIPTAGDTKEFSTTFTTETKQSFFTALIDDGGNLFIGNTKTGVNITEDDNGNLIQVALSKSTVHIADSSAYAGQGWYSAVPEPTSGLLLLLGVAGLALRRRRA